MVNVFAVPVFFICLRETLETGIIVSVLLAFLKQTLGPDRDPAIYKRLVRQVWWGSGLGLLICIIAGGAIIGAFYGIGKDRWSGTENIWEGSFSLIATLIITAMGAALLRVSKLQAKWRVKLAKALEAKDSAKKSGSIWTRFGIWCQKYSMFILPFVTVLREGLEAVIFIGGVSLGLPATAFPIPAVVGLGSGCLIGFLIYKGGNMAKIQTFLIISTCFLYLVAAGLFSKAVWDFEIHAWSKIVGGNASETGSGPGSYDIRKSVWHVNCCNPMLDGGGGWGIFNSLFGWQNSATYGSVLSYNFYWIAVILGFLAMRYNERNGHWPLTMPKKAADSKRGSNASSYEAGLVEYQRKVDDGDAVATGVRSIDV